MYRPPAVCKKVDASEVGSVNGDFEGENTHAGVELAWNIFQEKSFFADAVGGLQYYHISVEDKLINSDGSTDFLLPYLGLRGQRTNQRSHFSAGVYLETNLPDVIGTDQDEVIRLGRTRARDDWFKLRFDANFSFYLDPYLRSDWGKVDSASTLAHELAISASGQDTLHRRVAPTFLQTADS